VACMGQNRDSLVDKSVGDTLKDQGVDVRIILKCVFMRTGLVNLIQEERKITQFFFWGGRIYLLECEIWVTTKRAKGQ
jgi:hypothetical protein